jgi:hypothetical protein
MGIRGEMMSGNPDDKPKIPFDALPKQQAPENPARPKRARKKDAPITDPPLPPAPSTFWRMVKPVMKTIFGDGTVNGVRDGWSKVVSGGIVAAATASGAIGIYINGRAVEKPKTSSIETSSIEREKPKAKPVKAAPASAWKTEVIRY